MGNTKHYIWSAVGLSSAEFTNGLFAPAGEDLIGMMMVVMMVMIVTATGAALVMLMMMLVVMIIMVVMMLVVMIMAAAGAILVMLMMMVMIVILIMLVIVVALILVLFLHMGEIDLFALNGVQNLLAFQLLHRSCDDGGIRIQLADHGNGSLHFLIGSLRKIGTA